jgi:hypothetical protein
MSLIEAAAALLRERRRCMTAKRIIEELDRRGWWRSPTGRSPVATLRRRLLDEIKKGPQSQFIRHDLDVEGKREINFTYNHDLDAATQFYPRSPTNCRERILDVDEPGRFEQPGQDSPRRRKEPPPCGRD